jgi:aspartate-semialdehyde dehydrogenase
MSNLNVAVVGATGAVGVEILKCLERRKFPVGELRLLASARSAGKTMSFQGRAIPVRELNADSFAEIQIALFAAGSAITKKFAKAAIDAGAVVIDNSSAYRMDPEVPLIIPEVNPQAAREHKGLIANPNCSTIIAMTPLWPLHQKNPLVRVIAATYQAASGAGWAAMQELEDSTRAHLDGHPYTPKVLPHPYAFNLFSHNSAVDAETGYNEEELKMNKETRKIFGTPDLRLSATCVRVPVLRAHTIALTVEFKNPISPEYAREVLQTAPGIKLVDDPHGNYFPMPKDASGQDAILVGRIRRDISDPSGHSLCFLMAGDQLLKGAALNAVQIAELLPH